MGLLDHLRTRNESTYWGRKGATRVAAACPEAGKQKQDKTKYKSVLRRSRAGCGWIVTHCRIHIWQMVRDGFCVIAYSEDDGLTLWEDGPHPWTWVKMMHSFFAVACCLGIHGVLCVKRRFSLRRMN